jgi:hypothetical protein
MRTQRLFWLPVVLGVLFAGSADALPIAYTDSVAFLNALPGPATTLDFDSTAAGTTLASGSTLEGITFTYDFGGVELAVTDGNQFGGGGPFDTTSGANFLGTDDADLLQDGDDFSLSFAPVNAIGMFFITADALNDDDITLTAGGATASLMAADVEQTLGDGSEVFFLGLVDSAAAFTSAGVATIGGGFFLYNVDDIVTAVPEPGTFVLLGAALLGLTVIRRQRLR